MAFGSFALSSSVGWAPNGELSSAKLSNVEQGKFEQSNTKLCRTRAKKLRGFWPNPWAFSTMRAPCSLELAFARLLVCVAGLLLLAFIDLLFSQFRA